MPENCLSPLRHSQRLINQKTPNQIPNTKKPWPTLPGRGSPANKAAGK